MRSEIKFIANENSSNRNNLFRSRKVASPKMYSFLLVIFTSSKFFTRVRYFHFSNIVQDHGKRNPSFFAFFSLFLPTLSHEFLIPLPKSRCNNLLVKACSNSFFFFFRKIHEMFKSC